MDMCFRIKKLSLGNSSLKQNKTNIHTYTQNKLKSLILKMSLSASNLHCRVACLRFRLLNHNWQSPRCAAQSTLTNGHHSGWESRQPVFSPASALHFYQQGAASIARPLAWGSCPGLVFKNCKQLQNKTMKKTMGYNLFIKITSIK